MNITKISQYISAQVHGSLTEKDIKWLLTDSRSLSFPAQSLFFAIKTRRSNGHEYIAELYRQQLRYFVVSEMHESYKNLPEAVFLKVPDTLRALQQLAAKHRSDFNIPVIGITGSNGKTVVKEWLYQLLQSEMNVVRSPRSYNSQIGVPLSVWGLNEKTQMGIFEAGISLPGEMVFLEKIIKPNIGVFTNLGEAHQENFQSLKQKCEEKLQLFADAKVLIYNVDNKLIDISVKQSNFHGQLFGWGKTEQCTLRILDLQKAKMETQILLRYHDAKFAIEFPFTDDASVENVMQCVSVLLYLGFETAVVAAKLRRLEPVAMRLEVKNGTRNCLIINDSYNSDLNSLKIALDFLKQQATDKDLSRTLVLSDILQSGHSSADLYASVVELLKTRNIQRFIGIGTEISQQAHLFKGMDTAFFEDTESFLKSGLYSDFRNEIILLKGSRKFRFEDVLTHIELIAHETVLEVNLNALVENLNYFRSKLRPETKVMSMVKAFAYGSGSVEVARTLQHHRCDYLAVAVADEGAELRREGIRIPIVVMNPEKAGFGLIFDNNLEPEIYSFKLLEAFIAEAAKIGATDYPIHLKIDSGMHRLGFEPKEIDKLIELLANQTNVKARSVFSHLAGADETRFDAFTRQQAQVFVECADKISAAFPHYIMRHLLNSAGIERFSEFQFDMVRLGIGHYGVTSLPNTKLAQVCSLRTVILQIKLVKAGETIGYSRNGLVTSDKKIAILPIGYADGFDRKLSNGVGEVFVNGKRAKVIGNVSMDLITIDITNIEASEGDTVEIFGSNISITEVAEKLQTIPYEVLTSISRRVKRVYFQE